MKTANVVIIGGGVTGVSIAFHLAGLGVRRIVVLERKFLGAGGTGRSVGIVRQLYPTPETTRMVRASLDVFRDFGNAVGGQSGYIACGALIGVAPSMRAGLLAQVEQQRTLGVRAQVLDPTELSRIEPRIDPVGLGAVLYEPESGYGDPAAVTAGYAEAARRRGVSIQQGSNVVAIMQSGEQVTGVVTETEQIATPIVVNAAGLWSRKVAQLVGLDLPIVVGRHPVFIVKRQPAFGIAHMVYLDLAGGSYVRPETGSLTLTGSLTDDEAQHPMDPDLLGNPTDFDEASQTLQRTARALPGLSDAQFVQGYAGAFDITPDWMPILDETPRPGFFVAAGMSGHGFKLAPMIGAMMGALITRTASPINLAPFRLDRFAGARPSGSFVASYLK
jgi:glycine/D-amino acid oxidase-like deaminating enzyme